MSLRGARRRLALRRLICKANLVGDTPSLPASQPKASLAPEDLRALCQWLGQRLLALPEPEMRRATLKSTLDRLSDPDAVQLMAHLARRGREAPAAELATLVLAAVIDSEELGYQRHAALYVEAKRVGEDLVARLLLTAGRQPGTSRPVLSDPVVEPSQPLGVRKSLARGQRRHVLERLLFDPDETVLRILLQNPRCVTRDAVNLAARRPTSPEAQREVFASRFSAIYEVRLALALNPYTPVDLSARLLPGLLRSDVQQVRRSLELAPALRAAADEVLKARA